MHIPDGFLDLWICGVFYAISGAVILFSSRKVRGSLGRKRSPLIGVLAAGIFAAQMLNWPIPGGTSAHFVGGSLAAILVGPYAGSLVMLSVLVIQCLLFGDGGITALGANVFNMGIVAVFSGWYIYKALKKYNKTIAAFLAGWIGIFLGAVAAGFELGISSVFKYKLATTVTVMAVGHGLLGIVEGIITSLVVGYLLKTRPDLLYSYSGE